MVYEVWRELVEESEGDSQARRPEISHVFLMDRGRGWSGRRRGLLLWAGDWQGAGGV